MRKHITDVSNDEMGLSLNPFDWFGSDTKKFTKEENIAAGYRWLRQVYVELAPNATYEQFINALRQDNYGVMIEDEYFVDSFVETCGFNFNTSSAITDKVKAGLVKALGKDKKMLPTRKDIMSAFLNPDFVKWTYWDATKVVASELSSDIYDVAKTTANAAMSVTGFLFNYGKYLLIAAGVGVGYLLYKNRDEVADRIKEKGFKAIGLGKNPITKTKKKKKKRTRPVKLRTYTCKVGSVSARKKRHTKKQTTTGKRRRYPRRRK